MPGFARITGTNAALGRLEAAAEQEAPAGTFVVSTGVGRRYTGCTNKRGRTMAEDQRPGTIYWIDHFAVPSNDLDRWIKFQINVVGAKLARINGLTTEARQRGQGGVAAFCQTPYTMVDGFLASEELPAAADPGAGLP